MLIIAPGQEAKQRYLFDFFKGKFVFSLESPHRGDSNEYAQFTIYNIRKKITLKESKSAAMGFLQGTHERVRNSRGKRVISV